MGRPLVTQVVHFYPKNNAKTHNTSRYEVLNPPNGEPETTIVRRGQPFTGFVSFDRPYNDAEDQIQFIFTLGARRHRDTQGSVLITADVTADKYSWSVKFLNSEGNNVIFEVSTPVDTPVGKWRLRVVTKGFTAQARFNFQHDLYILFNPWNPDDQTYMADTELLQEYILNDVGKIWMGPYQSTSGKPWAFGQFDDEVLPAVMFMLDKVGLPYQNRGDAVKMARFISAAVNYQDDGGVLMGNWSGNYKNGIAPFEWTGSVDILAQFLETQESVCYGQCWVFAGVVTTVCRALGIPSRVVSNIVSAHDGNRSLTIDRYYTEHMDKEIRTDATNSNVGKDSVWNFHVWNDVWMARPDLPPGYGGWQAIDATPQELSSNKFQCGPASLEAIKQGGIDLNYDVDFVQASVNADVMRWRKDPHAENGYSLVETNKYEIGRMVLTKKPYVFDPKGYQDVEDITEQYKFREGTIPERLALMNSVGSVERDKRHSTVAASGQKDVTFHLRDIDTVLIGKDFRVTVDIKNNSHQGRNIKAYLSATSVYYNGVKDKLVQNIVGVIYVGAKKSHKISLLVTASDYLPKLVEYCNMKIAATAIVEETKQSWAGEDDFQVLRPHISIKFNEALIIGQPALTTLSFENPLDHPLTNCEYRLTSSGIMGRTLRFFAADIQAGQRLSTQLPVYPNKLGKITFVATFTSTQLKDCNGSASAEVYKA